MMMDDDLIERIEDFEDAVRWRENAGSFDRGAADHNYEKARKALFDALKNAKENS
jgi:hypothetical protein